MPGLEPDPSSERLVVIGNFDGVHLGHQAVLRAAAFEAERSRVKLCVLTFDPHPAFVLGRSDLRVLTPTARKVRLLASAVPGLEVVVERFDEQLAALSPEEFAAQILKEKLNAKIVLVGENFRFGKKRAGDLHTLRELGKSLDFEARALPLVGDADGSYSSTRIRERLAAGNVAGAAELLSRPHRLSGFVSRGDGRGKQLGFPTANLRDVSQFLPREGVYAVRVFEELSGGESRELGPGALNLGVRPTVDRPYSVEVYVLDFSEDLYEKTLSLDLLDFIRPVQKFSDLGALKTQIAKDVRLVRESAG